ncbi:MAG TPA: sigma-70 family RNA polymerase sigma factor [Solirubrobacteraceae bacterium]|nr:sigma-70 family RNA polymerase sigma factor [Solirubrobacteraceae bacterium]
MRADQDTVLARRAAAGDGAAFALLYDRHERRAYNLCYRITGSADDAADATQETFLKVLERLPGLADRELNFGSYLLTAARHASYDAIERRKRALPSAEIPDSAMPPVAAADEPALLAAHQEQIRAANEQLPTRQREVLALRELEELSYDEVAEIMGMNRNSVAQLISRARLNLRDALRRGALGAIPAGSPDCEAALPLLALAQDNGLDDAARADWLAGHLAGCATCRVRIEAMEEAGAAYRLWLPLVPALWLRAKVAEAAERTSAHASSPHDGSPAGADPSSRRARAASGRRIAAAAVVGAALLAGVMADIVNAPVHLPRAAVVTATPTPTPTPTPTATPTPAPRVVHHKAKPKPKPKRKAAPQPVVIAAAPTPTPAPPAPVAAAPRSKPKSHARMKPAEVAEAPPEIVVPDPTPVPVADPDPSPQPPQPDPSPQPPRPPVCPNCGITLPPPTP